MEVFKTARLFFWVSIISAFLVTALWGLGGLMLFASGWRVGAFTIMSAKLSYDEIGQGES